VTETLSIVDVSVSYDGRPAVENVSLEIRPGKITALLGPNGAGKSSLVGAIAGVVPTSGEMRLGERRLPLGRPEAIRRAGIAVVPEGHRILTQLSVADNLAVATVSLARVRRAEAIAQALAIFPELTPLLERDGRALSGGEQQMLAIAQALVISPRCLIIDELSLGLAPVIVRRLATALVDVAATGTGILVIEQFTELALELASQAYVMSRGRIAHSGDVASLRAAPDLLAAHYLASAAAD
jgi:branched-chain amino acid transport system ATP-binding protein